VTLAWNPSTSTNVVSYKVYCGLASGVYTNAISVGVTTNATITNLTAGVTYYFVATAVDASGNESPFSNEAVYSVPANSVVSPTNQAPTLNSISNMTVISGIQQKIVLTGISSGLANTALPVTITAVSSSTKFVPTLTINYTNPNPIGILTFTPMQAGTATVSVTVNNGQTTNNKATQSFAVTIYAVGSTAPVITSKLTNHVALAGQTVTFSVTAGGTTPLQYQWQCNSSILSFATNATLKLTNVTSSQVGQYRVTVSNGLGVTNTAAALSVYSNAAATLATATPPSHGQFALTVNGVTGYKYVVQVSSNLVSWTSALTNTAPFTFVDTNASKFNRRFYRSFYKP